MTSLTEEKAVLERAVAVLIRLVRKEYGDRRLSEIALIWGDATELERQALDSVEGGEK